MSISPNTTIAQYTIVSKLGEGGMGEVWRARIPWIALAAVSLIAIGALLFAAADELAPQFSPDGKWLAYASDETGTYEIYVQSFADGKLGSDRKRISATGGTLPVWRRDGSELFFVAQNGELLSVAIKTSGTELEFGNPTALFKTRMLAWSTNFHELDVSQDGQRFLIGTLIGDSTSPPPTVLVNWTALVKK